MSRHVGQYAQSRSDDGSVASTHAVHAIVEVGSVRHGCDDKRGDEYEQNPSAGTLGATVVYPVESFVVVEVVVLEERNGSHGRLARFALVIYHGRRLGHGLHIFAYNGLGRKPERNSYHASKQQLTQQLVARFHAVLVAAQLDEVVDETKGSEPQDGDDEQVDIYVVEPPEQQCRNHDCTHDDDSTHRWRTLLLNAVRVDFSIACRLQVALTFHIGDETLACPHRDEQREHQCNQ